MADQKDIRRRVLGAFFLLAAAGMLIVGETVLKERLRSLPMGFLIYWMACFIFVGLAVLMAVLDIAIVRRRVREEQRQLFEDTLAQIARAKEATSKRPPENSGKSK